MDPAGRGGSRAKRGHRGSTGGEYRGEVGGFEDPSFEKIQRVQPSQGIRPALDGQHYNDEAERSRETDLY